MKRAAVYARVSRAYKEDDERITIEAQLSDCEGYCNRQGIIVVRRYVDKDKYRVRGKLVNPSGTRKDRPGYTEMLKAALAGEFDVIVAWKEDRLYRGAYAALPLSEVLDQVRNLNVELVMDKFDQKMLGIKAAIAKLEIDNIRDRMVMGRRVRIMRGEVPGGPTRYGYDKGVDKKLIVNPSEAHVVRMVFDWYLEGHNSMEIRRRLGAMDTPPRIGNIWSKATIQNILTFDGYATGQYTTTLDGEIYTIPCEQIIPISIWRKSRDIREMNKKYRGRNVKEDYLCRGLVVCPCGWLWQVRTSRGKYQKGKSGYYGCARKDHQPESVHQDCPGTIGAKKLDAYVWNFLVDICNHPELICTAIDEKITRLQSEGENIEDEAEELQKQLDILEEERHWVITMARKGKISEDDMGMQLTALEFQALDFRKKQDEKLSAIVVQQQGENLKLWADQYLREMANGLQALQVDIYQFCEEEQESLFQTLGADRFLVKYNGDILAALKWAIFEEKRKIVKMLVEKVIVVKGEAGEKKITPILTFNLPVEFASLVYDHQSLAYIEQVRQLSEEVKERNGLPE